MFELFSRRNKPKPSGPYIYDVVPHELRIQLCYLLDNCTGTYDRRYTDIGSGFEFWTEFRKLMFEELGRPVRRADDPKTECYDAFLNGTDEHAIDFIDLAFRAVVILNGKLESYDRMQFGIKISPEDAATKLNWRLGQHHLGYKFVDAELIRVDTQYTHQQITEPAFASLNMCGFNGARDEFHRAHAAYLKSNNREAIREAQNAFESTLKAICQARKWKFETRDGASRLIEIVLKNELVPPQVQEQLATLSSSLRSIGAIRNNTPGAGHGQGVDLVQVPTELAAYVLHLTGAAIVFLSSFHHVRK